MYPPTYLEVVVNPKWGRGVMGGLEPGGTSETSPDSRPQGPSHADGDVGPFHIDVGPVQTDMGSEAA